jgi:hypothetical protein
MQISPGARFWLELHACILPSALFIFAGVEQAFHLLLYRGVVTCLRTTSRCDSAASKPRRIEPEALVHVSSSASDTAWSAIGLLEQNAESAWPGWFWNHPRLTLPWTSSWAV